MKRLTVVFKEKEEVRSIYNFDNTSIYSLKTAMIFAEISVVYSGYKAELYETEWNDGDIIKTRLITTCEQISHMNQIN